MREEIQSLRNELNRAREARPPQSAGTVFTVDSSSVMAEVSYVQENQSI